MNYLEYQSIQTYLSIAIGLFIVLLAAVAWYQADREDKNYQAWLEYERVKKGTESEE